MEGSQMTIWQRWLQRAPLLALGALTLNLAAIVVVDVLWVSSSNEGPMWYVLYHEAGITEHLQWTFLGAAAMLSIWNSARVVGREARYWRWFGIGLLLMLIEDAGNTSHRVRVYLGWIVGEELGSLGRLPVFLALAALLVGVAVLYRDVWLSVPGMPVRLVSGYLLYGLASTLSVPFNIIGRGYQETGEALFDGVLGGRLPSLPEKMWWWDGTEGDTTAIVFMDFVIEESIELLAASLLFAAVFTGFQLIRTREPLGQYGSPVTGREGA